jgi:hypothetical protein
MNVFFGSNDPATGRNEPRREAAGGHLPGSSRIFLCQLPRGLRRISRVARVNWCIPPHFGHLRMAQ